MIMQEYKHLNQTCVSVNFSPAEVLLMSEEHKDLHCGLNCGHYK